MNHQRIDEMAERAIRKRRLAKLDSMLELVIEDLVAMDGVKEVRKRLLAYARRMREFHT